VRCPGGHVIAPHVHGWHQLIYASDGVMSVRTAQGEWVVPPHRAVWVPAGVEHSIEMVGTVLMQTLYLPVRISPRLPHRCSAVNVSPLLRELILHAIDLGMLDRRIPAQRRVLDVLLDQLRLLPSIPLRLPTLSDERARRVAGWLRERPDDPGLMKQLAGRCNSSPRTLERIFRRETGMTFGKWRQQLRLLQAMRLLASGRRVTQVALEVGYDSASAFIAMFRRTLGTTPRKYFGTTSSARARELSIARASESITSQARADGCGAAS
jgi:AraC-like DNA-binding protein